MNSPCCPALMFIYILMPVKEEWVLVQLGSQHKCVERPVRPVFPDFLSVSCDYDSAISSARVRKSSEKTAFPISEPNIHNSVSSRKSNAMTEDRNDYEYEYYLFK